MLPNEKVRERLDTLIRMSRTDDYTSISTLIGKNHAYIQQFITRGIPKRLKEEDRRTIARYFKVPEWELGGPVESAEGLRYFAGFSERPEAAVVMIPSYDISASAGFGAFVEREWTDEFMPFQPAFLKTLTQSGADHLSVLKVEGDSMMPTLNHGDRILVDTLDVRPRRDGIYVIRRDDTLSVKRISINPSSGLLTIKSDNALYETWSGVSPGEVQIIGRVMWAGRIL